MRWAIRPRDLGARRPREAGRRTIAAHGARGQGRGGHRRGGRHREGDGPPLPRRRGERRRRRRPRPPTAPMRSPPSSRRRGRAARLGVTTDVRRRGRADPHRGREATFGPIDLFFANAGVGVGTDLETADDDWRSSMDVNLYGPPLRGPRRWCPAGSSGASGYFLATASAAGLLTQIGSAPYAVSKHAAVAFAEWLSVTYGDRGLQGQLPVPDGRQHATAERASGSDGTEHRRRRGAGGRRGAGAGAGRRGRASTASREERFLILPHPEVLTFLQRKTSDYDRWLAGMRRLQATGRRRVRPFAGCRRPRRADHRRLVATAPPAARQVVRHHLRRHLGPPAARRHHDRRRGGHLRLRAVGPFTVGIRSFEAGSLAQITDFAVTDENGNALATTPPDASISGQWEWSFAPDERRDPHVHGHVRRGRRGRGRARRRRAVLEVPRHRPPRRRHHDRARRLCRATTRRPPRRRRRPTPAWCGPGPTDRATAS